MKKTLLVSSLLIGTLLIAGTASARMGGHGGGFCDGPRDGHGGGHGQGYGMTEEMHESHMGQRLDFMEIALDLTEDQREQLEEFGEKHWEQRQAIHEKMQALRKEMRELAHAEEFDADAFRAKAVEQAELKTQKHAQRAGMKAEFFSVLNPGQQAKAEKLHELRMAGKGGMHGKGMHGKGSMHGSCENCPKMDGHKGRHGGDCAGYRMRSDD